MLHQIGWHHLLLLEGKRQSNSDWPDAFRIANCGGPDRLQHASPIFHGNDDDRESMLGQTADNHNDLDDGRSMQPAVQMAVVRSEFSLEQHH